MPKLPPAAQRAAIALLALLLGATALPAQPEETKPIRIEAMRAVAYRLENATPIETAGLLRSLFQHDGTTVRVTADERTNTVVVVGPDSVHRHVEALLATLDRDVGEAPQGEETRIIRIQHHSIDALLPVAKLHDVELAASPATNSIVARGPVAVLDQLAATLAALDIDTPAIELEGWVLEHGRGKQVAGHADLAPLAGELTKSGLDGYGVTSRWSVRSLAGERFTSQQEYAGRRLAFLSVKGTVRIVDEGKSAQIALDLRISLTLEDGAEGQRDTSGSFQLQTTLETQPGKLVVIGLAPTGDDDAPPLALVVRVKP